MIKLEPHVSSNLIKYCLDRYNKYPFIMKRNPADLNYTIITEYSETLDYVLIIENEINEDQFIVVNSLNYKPFILSENPNFKFVLEGITQTNYNLVNLINCVYELSIPNNISTNRLLEILFDYGFSVVYNKRIIYGFIYMKSYMTINPIFYDVENILIEEEKINLYVVMENIKKY